MRAVPEGQWGRDCHDATGVMWGTSVNLTDAAEAGPLGDTQ